MKLGRQWETRFKIWDEAFLPNLYHELDEVTLSAFTTMEHLSLEQVRGERFLPFPRGTEWGEKWQYSWVHAKITLSEKADGKRVLLHLGAGPEMLVYVDGRETGSIDKQHRFVELAAKGEADRVYDVLAEVYAGHGVRLENGGIYTRDDVPVPEPPLHQCVVQKSHYGIWDQELFEVYVDYHTLYGLWQALPGDSLRCMEIGRALQDFTCAVDFEAEEGLRRESIFSAKKLLQPLLKKKNSPTVPEYTVFGQSHIDLAWLWTLEETKRKSARTYSNQLALMERYPEYRFLLCEPPLLENLREYYPNLYERVREKVKTGQMIPDGALYVESDTNLAGGESLIRQFVWGKRWYLQELNVDSRMAWMPDTFGYSGALPQIMAGCRVPYFATQKLLRSDPECEQFPYNIFWWEGIDGTRILSHVYKKNNAVFTPQALVERWEKDRNQKENIDTLMFPFGYGDGGGGPTELMVETCLRCEDLEGLPRCRMEAPVDFFDRLDGDSVDNVYYGELYLAWHRGTYTAQARLKRKIRQAEYALREAEFLAGLLRLAEKDSTHILPKGKLEELWRILLIREFHDILPGTSIQRVNEEAYEAAAGVEQESRLLSEKLLRLLAGGEAVFNSLSWKRAWKGIVLPPCGYVKLHEQGDLGEDLVNADNSGEHDKSGGESCPSAGLNHTKLTGLSCVVESDLSNECYHAVTLEENSEGYYVVCNDFYRATLDKQGCIISLIDRHTGFEYAAEPLNRFRLYRDVNIDYDAWELGRMYEQNEEPLTGEVSHEVKSIPKEILEAGTPKTEDLLGEVLIIVNRKEPYFSIIQTLHFYGDTPRIDFETKIDWHERHRLLKVDFPTAIYTREVLQEIQFGYIKRPTHRSRQYEKDLYETCHHKYAAFTDGENGLAILNDGRYGMSAKDSRMSLTLLRSPVIPDMTADQGQHTFTYSLLPFRGPFSKSRVVQEAYQLNISVTESRKDVLEAYQHNIPVTDSRKDTLEPIWSLNSEAVSFFRLESKHCILETCKPAMDEEKGVILRLYEAHGCAEKVILSVPSTVKAAFSCNMLEERQEELDIRDGRLTLQFRSFEIKTILLLV